MSGFYDRSKGIVLTRNRAIDMWVIVEPNGKHVPIDYLDVDMKAGDVFKHVRTKIDPAVQVGFLSEMFGLNCKAIYGEVVWMKG